MNLGPFSTDRFRDAFNSASSHRVRILIVLPVVLVAGGLPVVSMRYSLGKLLPVDSLDAL